AGPRDPISRTRRSPKTNFHINPIGECYCWSDQNLKYSLNYLSLNYSFRQSSNWIWNKFCTEAILYSVKIRKLYNFRYSHKLLHKFCISLLSNQIIQLNYADLHSYPTTDYLKCDNLCCTVFVWDTTSGHCLYHSNGSL